MLEEIAGWDLIPGEYYFIRNDILNEVYAKHLFLRYTDITYSRPIGLFYGKIKTNDEKSLMRLDLLTFYRYVTPEEYRVKVKEKYDATCLDIVLKRLVNETFVW